jgi:hypothetical protein
MRLRSTSYGREKIGNGNLNFNLERRIMGIESVLIIALVAFIFGLILGVVLSRPPVVRY